MNPLSQILSKLGALLPHLKDAIVIVPLLGTALAITYDVGFFGGIGLPYFTMFTLSEHIVFALEAVPFVIIVIVAIPICLYAVINLQTMTKRVVPDDAGEGDTEEAKMHDVSTLRVTFVTICVLIIGASFALVGYFVNSAMATMAGGGLVGVLLLAQIGAPLEVVAIGSFFAGTFLLTLGFALDTSRNMLKAPAPTYTLEA
ncbi:hypothetical protein [Bradyrhizobium japonicum]|uniref:hypothetical protein n=1 Tax=Bradyrhizobium japonicum TaxID=375 RepID=UPI0004870ADE|nr:hypothetical protein [Bradyrhizobium japonicum]